jgi:hypothetical protein
MTTTHRIGTGVALALALATAAGPATAGQIDPNAHGSDAPAVSPSLRATNPVPPPSVVRVTTQSGFDWGDAGIGAAGGFAITIIGVGGALAATQHRRRTPTPQP